MGLPLLEEARKNITPPAWFLQIPAHADSGQDPTSSREQDPERALESLGLTLRARAPIRVGCETREKVLSQCIDGRSRECRSTDWIGERCFEEG